MNILCVWHGFVHNLNHFYVGFSFCWSNCRSWFSLEQNCRLIEDKLSSTTLEVQSSGWKLLSIESTVLFREKINFYKLIILQNGYCWCIFIILLVESWRIVVFSGTVNWFLLKMSFCPLLWKSRVVDES